MENERMFYLDCVYDTRKSFYRKAKVEIEEDNTILVLKLYSYNTLVAIVTYDKLSTLIEYDYLGKYSQTTTRHQKEFFRQNGLNDNEIKEIFKKGHLEIKKEGK